MRGAATEELLGRVSAWLDREMGLYFSAERRGDLQRSMGAAARALGSDDAESYMRRLLERKDVEAQVVEVAPFLTVGETYFFRDEVAMRALREHVLPGLIAARQKTRTLRIWSAGCCTGEEPYSMAMMLRQMLPEWREWEITIVGTDVHAGFLERAREGVYRGWSFRETRAEVRERFFRSVRRDCHELEADVRRMVGFEELNLAQEQYRSPFGHAGFFDLVLCRNVLMYFSAEQSARVLERLGHALARDGWLAMSASEAPLAPVKGFVAGLFPGAAMYAREDAARPGVVPGLEFAVPVMKVEAELIDVPAIPLPEMETAAVIVPEASSAEDTVERARELFVAGRSAEAVEELLRVVTENPEDALALALMARVRANEGSLAEALEWSERAIAAEKLDAGAHYLRGVILQESGREDEAAEEMERTLYLDPEFVMAHFALGNVARRGGRGREAARHFENARRALRRHRSGEELAESEGMTVERMEVLIGKALEPAMSMRGEAR